MDPYSVCRTGYKGEGLAPRESKAANVLRACRMGSQSTLTPSLREKLVLCQSFRDALA